MTEIKEYIYDENEVRELYSSVGWRSYTDDMEALKKGFAGSLTVLAAYNGGELTGIIRAVGDGHTVLFIQDILVRPDRQRQGIGSALLKAVLDRYKNVRQTVLVTDDTEKTKAFYLSAGFAESGQFGCCCFMRYKQ